MSRLILQRIYYPVLTLGYGRRLGVWVRGCGRGCPGCISPELQCYDGVSFPVEEIIAALPDGFTADGLTVSGGEPFDQADGVAELVDWFSGHISQDVLIFTGYTLEELYRRKDPATEQILRQTAVLVDGPYVAERNEGVGLRGSSNQRIFVWKYSQRYQMPEYWNRTVQFVEEQNALLQIGIPPVSDTL